MTSESLSFSAVGAAWRFLATAWRRAWAAMLVTAVTLAAPCALGLWSPRSPWRLAALLAVLVGAAMAEGALYRVALEKERPGPGGLQWGGSEWRLGAVWGLSLLFVLVLAALALVIIFFAALGVASSGPGFVMSLPATWVGAVDGPRRAVVGIVGAVCLAGLVWGGTRIALGAAASIDRDSVQVLSTWVESRRVVKPILLGRSLLGLPPIGFAATVLWGVSHTGHQSVVLTWSASLAAGLALAGLWLPLSVGLMAYLYRHSRATGP